jgi:hypothetical protein
MLRLKRKSALVPCLAALLFAGNAFAQLGPISQTPSNATPSAAAKQPQHHSAKRSKIKAPEPPVVQPPPPPPTPEQMAPVAPTVTYQGGQLSIQSNNATLAQVLRSVQAKTGASFDIPASANSDRVVAQLGPGQPRDVLATLLNGSKFNYIIMGSPTQPGSVQKLILMPRQNTPITNTAQNRPAPQPQPEPQADDDYSPPDSTPVEDNTANQAQPPGGYRPGFTPNMPNQPGENQPEPDNNGQPQQGVKTPEQLLQELQRMQQQQQMYQQQLNPANQNQQPQPQ